jgi:hypothetical protein
VRSRLWLCCLSIALVFGSCTSTFTAAYPYLITTDNCNCRRFTYRDERGRFEIDVSARYEVTDRISSTIELVFRNRSHLALSLQQAYIKGTSANIRYPFNDRFQPMPYEVVGPGERYTMTLAGNDPDASDDPWLKIAGERVVLEIRGLTLGDRPVQPVVLTLIPYNPRLEQ